MAARLEATDGCLADALAQGAREDARDRCGREGLAEGVQQPADAESLGDAEIRQYIKYFHWIDAQPPGSVKASAGGH